MEILKKDIKLNFRMFNGTELGLVYAGASSYIEWIIRETEHYIEDLEEILTTIHKKNSPNKSYFMVGDPKMIPFFDCYNSLDEYLKDIKEMKLFNAEYMESCKKEFQIKNLITLNNSKK